MRPTPDEAVQLIKAFEGFVPTVYICPAGYPTIGYGHVVLAGENWSGGISETDATNLLITQDLPKYERGVLSNISVALSDLCYGALVSFTYNLGIGALQSSTLRQMVNEGRLEDAADQFPRWVYAGARVLPGLVRRRAAERAMWLRGLDGGR